MIKRARSAPRAECDNAACGHVEDALHEVQRQLHAHIAIVPDSRPVNHFHMRTMKVVDRHVTSRCHHITAPSKRNGNDAGANAKRLVAVLREHTQFQFCRWYVCVLMAKLETPTSNREDPRSRGSRLASNVILIGIQSEVDQNSDPEDSS